MNQNTTPRTHTPGRSLTGLFALVMLASCEPSDIGVADPGAHCETPAVIDTLEKLAGEATAEYFMGGADGIRRFRTAMRQASFPREMIEEYLTRTVEILEINDIRNFWEDPQTGLIQCTAMLEAVGKPDPDDPEEAYLMTGRFMYAVGTSSTGEVFVRLLRAEF